MRHRPLAGQLLQGCEPIRKTGSHLRRLVVDIGSECGRDRGDRIAGQRVHSRLGHQPLDRAEDLNGWDQPGSERQFLGGLPGEVLEQRALGRPEGGGAVEAERAETLHGPSGKRVVAFNGPNRYRPRRVRFP